MIAIITYDVPHRKTQDVVTQMLLAGHSDMHLIAIPWTERKGFQPVYTHRPTRCADINVELLAEKFHLSHSKTSVEDLDNYFTNNEFEHIVIAGAGLLPDTLAKHHRIINAHPGFLPLTKGLDALKWAIYYNHPIGVTTHFISEKADEGLLIDRIEVPVYFEDSFHNVAYRLYETEIEMLTNAISLLQKKPSQFESLANASYAANMRMPHHYEMIMMERFEERRRRSGSRRD